MIWEVNLYRDGGGVEPLTLNPLEVQQIERVRTGALAGDIAEKDGADKLAVVLMKSGERHYLSIGYRQARNEWRRALGKWQPTLVAE